MEKFDTRKFLNDNFKVISSLLNKEVSSTSKEEDKTALKSLLQMIQQLASHISYSKNSYQNIKEEYQFLISSFQIQYFSLILKPNRVKAVYIKLMGLYQMLENKELELASSYLPHVIYPSGLTSSEQQMFVIAQLDKQIGELMLEQAISEMIDGYDCPTNKKTLLNQNQKIFEFQMIKYYFENYLKNIKEPFEKSNPVLINNQLVFID